MPASLPKIPPQNQAKCVEKSVANLADGAVIPIWKANNYRVRYQGIDGNYLTLTFVP